MNNFSDEFIELRRTFIKLPCKYAQEAKEDDLDISDSLLRSFGKELSWGDLHEKFRIILLAEAGAGKTFEIRQTTQKLRSKGKYAFFLRLEHVMDGFDHSFEEGSIDEFSNWLSSNEEGWILLDSVDEARLANPLDFEKAIRKIAYSIRPALQRTHIVITGRVDSWRAKSDLQLCEEQLEFSLSNKQKKMPDDEVTDDSDEISCLENDIKSETTQPKASAFEIFSLCSLSSEQIAIFSRAKGVPDVSDFLGEIERHDAWAYTERPQDLNELIEFWEENKRIGSRLELMENSVERRLTERSENRAAANPMSIEQLQCGAKAIAAAMALLRVSIIRIPDGSNKFSGLDTRKVLPKWNDSERQSLLSRPIFDDAIYGSVRFHHRSVRDYLAAKWMHESLAKGASRKSIEDLFFQKKYGLKVLTPSMRSILSWLIIFDHKFLSKACSIEPEIVFEGGDPSRLPLRTRKKILRDVCAKIAKKSSKHSVTDYSSVQRFANTDIASELISLLKKYSKNTEISSFLVRMVWQGKIKQALPQIKRLANNVESEKYLRISAIRALKSIGTKEDFDELLDSISSQESKIERRVLEEVISSLPYTSRNTNTTIEWIFKSLNRTTQPKRYSVDGLDYALVQFVERLEIDSNIAFLKAANNLLERGPFIDKGYCNISKQFGWILRPAIKAVEMLLLARHKDSLDHACISIISKMPKYALYEGFVSNPSSVDLAELSKNWKDLKFSMFWKDIEDSRGEAIKAGGGRLTDFWQAHSLRQFWNFDENDFDRVVQDITTRPLTDDKLVSISLAFQIYNDSGRPKELLEQLQEAVENDIVLSEKLDSLRNPPPVSEKEKEWIESEKKWELENKERITNERKFHSRWKEWLDVNYPKLCDETLLRDAFDKGRYLSAQYYLIGKMRDRKENSTHWAQSNWRDLIETFGSKVANSLRAGLILSWRLYRPSLRSEKDEKNGTPISVTIGLSGLEIEARETKGWPENLSNDEIELACRYAFKELNGFPSWFPKLFLKNPVLVKKILLKEIDWELENSQSDRETHYVLDKLRWSGQTLWEDVASDLLERLQIEPKNYSDLGKILKIILSSTIISDQSVSTIASQKCRSLNDTPHIARWFAVWIGVQPDQAIQSLTNFLLSFQDKEEAKIVAMNVVVNLSGSRRERSHARESYKNAVHLKNLYLLMHKYIKIEEDINRANTGVYTPELRDDAQNARDRLFTTLENLPGKETFIALNDIAKAHPDKSFRSWAKLRAKSRAESDSDLKPWDYSDLNSFITSFEDQRGNKMHTWEKIAGFVFAVLGIISLLVLSIWIPNPTETQYTTFRTLMALCAAGVAGVLTGFLHIEGKYQSFSIRAGGALAIFVIVYFSVPAKPSTEIEPSLRNEAPSVTSRAN